MARNTILLRGKAREEARTVTAAACRPGMIALLQDNGLVRPHNVDGGQCLPVFVKEQHENQGAGIDTNIATGDEAIVLFPELNGKINAFTTATILEGEYVTPDGAGGVRVADSTDYVIGQAAADSDLSGAVGRCEIYVAPLGVSA